MTEQPPYRPRHAQGTVTAPAAPARTRRRWPWIAAAGLAALIVVIAIAAAHGAGTPGPAAAPAPMAGSDAARAAGSTNTITYKVTGDAGVPTASITYIADSLMSQQQANGETLPWQTSVQMDKSALVQPLVLTARSGATKGKGAITCEIDKDGVKVVSQTSTGPGAVVTCSGMGQ